MAIKLPTWVIGEDFELVEPEDSYVVHLAKPFLVARVTQKRGGKLMLTLRAQPEAPDRDWYYLLDKAALYWALQTRDPSYQPPPEILVNMAAVFPRFLICDDASLKRSFLVHTDKPAFVGEIKHGQLIGEFPGGAEPVLKRVAALLGRKKA